MSLKPIIPPDTVSHSQVVPFAAEQISVSSNLTPTLNGFFFAEILKENIKSILIKFRM